MRRILAIVMAAGLILAAFIARDLTIMNSANAAVAGLDEVGLQTDADFRDAVEWVTERCAAVAVADDRLEFRC